MCLMPSGVISSAYRSLILFGENGPPDLFQEAEIRGYLLLLLGWILQSLEFYQDRQANTDALKAIIEYCNENYRHSIQLDDLEKALNINKYYISHLFHGKKLVLVFLTLSTIYAFMMPVQCLSIPISPLRR